LHQHKLKALPGFYSVLVQTFILGAPRRAKRGEMGKTNPDVNTTHKMMIRPTTTNNSFQLLQSEDHYFNNFQTIKLSRSILANHIFE
jgi:hypothetical protein